MKIFTIQRDVMHGQTKGCWLAVQFGYTRLLFHDLWPRDYHAGALVQVFVCAPAKYREGYRRTHCGIYGRWNWRIVDGCWRHRGFRLGFGRGLQ